MIGPLLRLPLRLRERLVHATVGRVVQALAIREAELWIEGMADFYAARGDKQRAT